MSDDTAIREAAQRYIDHGWKVIPIFGVREDGTCMCTSSGTCWAGPSSAGKHPMGAREPDGHYGGRRWAVTAITSPGELPAGANIGLLTGHASGVWALDVDPKNAGDAALATLLAEHEGGVPLKTWSQRTGSGGQHLLFAMPEDFTPTNANRLPAGLDVRGEGGQIVLAPSRSAVGAYMEAGLWIDPEPAPDWLLDFIRPEAPRSSESIQNYIDTRGDQHVSGMLHAGGDRGMAYAQAAVTAQLERLRTATPGSRGRTAFEVACRLVEIANASWSGLSERELWPAYEAAAQQAMSLGGAFNLAEARSAWNSADRTVGLRPADLPATSGVAEFVPWSATPGGMMPPFGANGSPAITAPLAPVPAGISDPFADALPLGYAPAPAAAAVQDLRGQLLRRSQLDELPRPRPLIQGVLWRGTDTWLIGASGSGKSFVGLDWACHIASGRQWNNRRTAQGNVLWVVAEGATGIQQRVDAWERSWRKELEARELEGDDVSGLGTVPDNLIILPVPVRAITRVGRLLDTSPQWRELTQIVGDLRPALVGLDTQARMTLGLNENDNAEMGEWVQAVARLRSLSPDTCNLVVHHTGRNGGDARGASSIDGAQDVEWKVERVGPRAEMRGRIKLEKNKDGADGVEHPFVLKFWSLGFDADGEQISSLTVDYDAFGAAGRGERASVAAVNTANQGEVLEFMAGLPAFGVTRPQLLDMFNKARVEVGRPVMSRETLTKILSRPERDSGGLLELGLVARNGEKWAHAENFRQWQLEQD